MQFAQPPRGVSRLPTATGRDPWANGLNRPSVVTLPGNPGVLAFGAGNLTQSAAYRAANLPPYNAAR